MGTVTINYGSSQTFTITPATGYGVYDVQVDGVSLGGVTSYQFSNVISNHTLAATFAVLPQPPNPSAAVLGIKAGGADDSSGIGIRYLADRYFTGGMIETTSAAIKGTPDASLYQAGRVGNFSYAIPLPNGNYDLTLKFAETTHSSAGQLVFDVLVGGTRVLRDLDIYAVSGKNTALDITFTVKVTEGILNIQFVPKIGEAKINAFLISNASSSPIKPPGRIKRYFTTEPKN
jgi:hypothetical protein